MAQWVFPIQAHGSESSLVIRVVLASALQAAAGEEVLVEQPVSPTITLVATTPNSSQARRHRYYQYSENQIVVTTHDSSGNELYRDIHADPRLIRAEITGADGQLQSRSFYLPTVEFSFAVPANSNLGSLKILKPKWDGAGFSFELLGTVAINN